VSRSARVELQQERATRRLANFLDVAAVLFAEIGYEATTMTAIAERSGWHALSLLPRQAIHGLRSFEPIRTEGRGLLEAFDGTGGDTVPHRICGEIPGTRHRISKGTSRLSAVTGRADPVFS
jgi:hypothetical protein